MKERPILFSGAMVRAILSGQKTQTRRVVKCESFRRTSGMLDYNWNVKTGQHLWLLDDEYKPCPYGQPGDRLWVRENGWERPERTPQMMREGADTWASYYFDADGISDDEADAFKAFGFKRRPSIHMPRWACRIVLEIVSVRVERLNEISEADAMAEGIQCEERIIETRYEAGQHNEVTADMYHVDGKRSDAHYSAGECFQSLWESINGPESWNANTWVWVVEFKRVQQ